MSKSILEKIINRVIPNILFNAENENEMIGTSTTLSDSITNYKRLKIFWMSADGQYDMTEIYSNNAKQVISSAIAGSKADLGYYKQGRIIITDNKIELDRQVAATVNSTTAYANLTNAIRIYRVEAFKE